MREDFLSIEVIVKTLASIPPRTPLFQRIAFQILRCLAGSLFLAHLQAIVHFKIRSILTTASGA